MGLTGCSPTRMSGVLDIQSGIATTDINGVVTVTFARAFASTPIVILTPIMLAATQQAIRICLDTGSPTTTGFSAHFYLLNTKTENESAHVHTTTLANGAATGVGFSINTLTNLGGGTITSNATTHQHSINSTAGASTNICWLAILTV